MAGNGSRGLDSGSCVETIGDGEMRLGMPRMLKRVLAYFVLMVL